MLIKDSFIEDVNDFYAIHLLIEFTIDELEVFKNDNTIVNDAFSVMVFITDKNINIDDLENNEEIILLNEGLSINYKLDDEDVWKVKDYLKENIDIRSL